MGSTGVGRGRSVAVGPQNLLEGLVAPGQTPRPISLRGTSPIEPGPYATISSEYHLPARVHDDIWKGGETELWAHVTRPVGHEGKSPLLVFLHGNHATCGRGEDPRYDTDCSYSYSGSCPDGYVVVPNHMGYQYAAEKLASHGYTVVSVNANRLNCRSGSGGDWGLNLARGRLVLKHLEQLADWNRNGGESGSLADALQGTLDFSEIGLMGHSRGGEGMRAAVAQFRQEGSLWSSKIGEPGLEFKGLFEIAPVDGQSDRTLNATGMAWSVLLPACDGDVSSLEGVEVFDRMSEMDAEAADRLKATQLVWGTNHNFFNTEWQTSDSDGCSNHEAIFQGPDGGKRQRVSSTWAMMAFFRGFVGKNANADFGRFFDPLHALPAEVTEVSPVERGHIPGIGGRMLLETFDGLDGQSTHGVAHRLEGVEVSHRRLPQHSSKIEGATLRWDHEISGSTPPIFGTYMRPEGQGVDLRHQDVLSFRVSRDHRGHSDEETDFRVRLVMDDGQLSDPVSLREHLLLRGPTSHPKLQTARIPLEDFVGADLTRVRGVEFVFDQDGKGRLFMDRIEFSQAEVSGSEALTVADASTRTGERGCVADAPPPHVAAVVGLRRALDGAQEVVLKSDQPFAVRDDLMLLQVGDQVYRTFRYLSGDMKEIAFRITPEGGRALRSIGRGESTQVQVVYRSKGAQGTRWVVEGPAER